MKHLAFSALFLVGCAATAYQAVDGNGFGYSERIQDDGNVAVAFVGNEYTGLPRARRFAVCRASEVVAGMGRPLFSVVTESTGMGAVGAVAQCHGSACVSENVTAPAVTLLVRPIDQPGDTKGQAYVAGKTSPCREDQAEADKP